MAEPYTMTEEESSLVEELRSRVKDMATLGDDPKGTDEEIRVAKQQATLAKLYLASDSVCWRYVMAERSKARDKRLEFAEDMFRASIRWKAEVDIDAIMAEWGPLPDEFEPGKPMKEKPLTESAKLGDRMFYSGIVAKTKTGSLLGAERIGLADVGAFSDEVFEIIQRSFIKYCESMWRYHLHRNSFERIVVVFDMKDYGMAHMSARKIIKKLAGIVTGNYPELSHKLFIINAGWGIRAMFVLVSPFLPERTRRKIEVLGGEFTESIAAHVDGGRPNLPDFLGGDVTTHGVNVPERVEDVMPKAD